MSDEPVFSIYARNPAALTVVRTYRATQWRRRDEVAKRAARDEVRDGDAEESTLASWAITWADGVIKSISEWQEANPELMAAQPLQGFSAEVIAANAIGLFLEGLDRAGAMVSLEEYGRECPDRVEAAKAAAVREIVEGTEADTHIE